VSNVRSVGTIDTKFENVGTGVTGTVNGSMREFDATKDVNSVIRMVPSVPRGIPLIRTARPLNSTGRFPYLYWIGAGKAGETVSAARARTA
jgi:hypothetical protein